MLKSVAEEQKTVTKRLTASNASPWMTLFTLTKCVNKPQSFALREFEGMT